MSAKQEVEYQKLERLSLVSATKAAEIKKRMDRGEVGNGRFAMYLDKDNEHCVLDLEHVTFMDWRHDSNDDDDELMPGRWLAFWLRNSDKGFYVDEDVGEQLWSAYLRYIGAL